MSEVQIYQGPDGIAFLSKDGEFAWYKTTDELLAAHATALTDLAAYREVVEALAGMTPGLSRHTDGQCRFCGMVYPDHAPDCSWLRAKDLTDSNNGKDADDDNTGS